MNHRVWGTGTLLGLVAALALGSGAYACGDADGGGAGSGGFVPSGGSGGSGGGDAGGSGGGGAGGSGGEVTGPCTGVKCLVEGETCDPTNGQCRCTPTSCPPTATCNDDGLCEFAGCAAECADGEICVYDPRSTKFRCACNPTDDRCPEGQQCDGKTQTCVEDTPCDPECTTGESCDEATKTCKCGPGTCDTGYLCKAGKCVVPDPEEGEDCDPDLPNGSPDFDCVASGPGHAWLRKCTAGTQCSDAQRTCINGYCQRNECNNGVNGTNFGPCDADDGQWQDGDPATGTCVPLPAQGGVISVCVRAGNVKPGGACAFVPRTAGPAVQCRYDGVCLGAPVSQYEGCVENSECPQDQKCAAGVCHDACVGAMMRCAPGRTCVDGGCVPSCKADNECNPGSTCENDVCTPRTCSSDGPCGPGAYCTDDGVCTPYGRCEDLCNAGTAGTGQNDADCEDPAGECFSAAGNGSTAIELGYCRATCEAFGGAACPTFDGQNRYCRPQSFTTNNAAAPGTCEPQVNAPTAVGLACSPADNPNQPNACEDGALCVGQAPNTRCRSMCYCPSKFKMDGTCDDVAPQCTQFDDCRGFQNQTIGFCIP